MLIIEAILIASICILGTTIVWSKLQPALKGLKCEKCICSCPPGQQGPQGKPGLNCELISENGKLGCKYANGKTEMSNIVTSEAAGIGIVDKVASAYTQQLVLILVILLGGAAVLWYLNTLNKRNMQIEQYQDAWAPKLEEMQQQLKSVIANY